MNRFFISCFVIVAALLMLFAAGCASKNGMEGSRHVLYDFEKGVTASWSSSRIKDIDGNKVLGPYNSRHPRYRRFPELTIADIPKGMPVNVSFDLYLIGTHDSEGEQADRFWVQVKEGPVLFEMTKFPNTFADAEQKEPIGNVGKIKVKVSKREHPYWIERVTLTVPSDQIKDGMVKLDFLAEFTGRRTEFFALDNVNVEVPEG